MAAAWGGIDPCLCLCRDLGPQDRNVKFTLNITSSLTWRLDWLPAAEMVVCVLCLVSLNKKHSNHLWFLCIILYCGVVTSAFNPQNIRHYVQRSRMEKKLIYYAVQHFEETFKDPVSDCLFFEGRFFMASLQQNYLLISSIKYCLMK